MKYYNNTISILQEAIRRLEKSQEWAIQLKDMEFAENLDERISELKRYVTVLQSYSPGTTRGAASQRAGVAHSPSSRL